MAPGTPPWADCPAMQVTTSSSTLLSSGEGPGSELPASPSTDSPSPRTSLDPLPPAPAAAPSTAPKADPMEIAALELLLAEPATQDMVQRFGGPLQPLPTHTATGQGIQARYGADLGARLTQLQTAQQAVRQEYCKAMDSAMQAPGPDTPGSVYVPATRNGESEEPARWDFDPAAFTRQYASGQDPAQQAFAQLHGSDPLQYQEGRDIDGAAPSAHVLDSYTLAQGYTNTEEGAIGAWAGTRLEQPEHLLSPERGTKLIDKEYLWFDPVHGWSTDADNLKGNWLDRAFPMVVGGLLSMGTMGVAGSFMGVSSGSVTAAQSAVLGAVGSATTQLVTTGKLNFGTMLRSALTAGVATGIMDASGMGDMLKAQDLGTRMTAHLGKAAIQGVLQQAIGGKFKDGLTNSLLSSAASEVGAHLDQQIKAQLPELDPAQASALKLLGRAATSALRIAGSNDPAASFANDFLMGALQDAAADRKRGQEGREGQEGAQDKPEGSSTASSGLGLKPPRDWVDRLGRSEIADPSPEEAQAAFRQSERDYRSSTEHSVAGSSYVAQSGDSISRILGTSDPQAIGNFIRANGLASSHIVVGRNYFVPDDANAYGDSAALGQAVLHGDNARLAVLAQQRAAQQQAQWDALQTGAWRGRTDTQSGPVWHVGTPGQRDTAVTDRPRTGWWPALTGAATGVGQSLAHMAQGAVQAGADSLEQLGDILTFGANHDHPQMQEVWQRQRERGQALGRLASDPTGVATDMMESVAHRHEAANAITDDDYERWARSAIWRDIVWRTEMTIAGMFS